MSVTAIPPIPTSSSAIQLDDRGKPLAGYPLGQDYYLWLFALANLVQSSGRLVGSAVQLSGQKAAIVSTPIPLPALNGGMYNISFYASVDVPAGATSTLGAFTVSWTQNGLAKNASVPGVAGNLNTTVLQGQVPIKIDPATPINYSMGYASNPAAAMEYGLMVAVETVAT